MQSNSQKQDLGTQQNNDYISQGVYPSYQTAPPPSYSEYPQQPIGGGGHTTPGTPYITQTPLPQQNKATIVPIRPQPLANRTLQPITHNLKVFLSLSGCLFALWGILAFSLQIAIVTNSYSTYYSGFWTGFFLIFSGIIMMVIACRPSYPLAQFVRMFAVDLVFCTIGLVFAIVNYSLSTQCMSTSFYYCDDSLTSNLKIAHLVIFAVALVHTIVNMTYISKEQQKALVISGRNAPIY